MGVDIVESKKVKKTIYINDTDTVRNKKRYKNSDRYSERVDIEEGLSDYYSLRDNGDI